MHRRYYYHLLYFTFILLISCSKYSSKDILNHAEELIEKEPDSSLILLESIEKPEKLDRKNYARYGMLLIKAHKANKISIKSDEFITYIVKYYEEYPSKELMRAYFYAGQVAEEHQKYKEAEDYYLKVINYEDAPIPRIKAYAAYFLADIYLNNLHDYKKAIEYYNLALDLFREYEEDFREENILKLIGDGYVRDQQFDTGVDYYRMAIRIVSPDSVRVIAELYRNITITLINTEKYPEAIYAINKGIAISDSNEDLAIGYSIKADIFEKMNVKDSILHYNNKAITYAKQTNNYQVMYEAYQAIYEVAVTSKNLQLALDNYINFNNITGTLGQKQKYDDISFLERKIDFEKNRSAYRASRLKSQSIFLFVSLTIISLLAGFAFYRQKKAAYIKSISEALEARNETIRSVMGTRHQNINLYRRMVTLTLSPQKNKYRQFLDTANKILFGQDYEFEFEWEYASSLVNETYNNYVVRLTEKFPTLTELETKICVLLKIGFSLTEIADLIGKSSHTIYKYSSNIRKKLNIPENSNTIEYLDGELIP